MNAWKKLSNSRRRESRLKTSATYVGTRTSEGPCVVVRTEHGTHKLLPHLDLEQHSPVGFDWACTGARSAQLALALLAHVSGKENFARKHYEIFAHEIIPHLPQDRWELSGRQVLRTLFRVYDKLRQDQASVLSFEGKRRKIAIIRSVLPGNEGVEARGCGRSARTAATRALLNLLGNGRLRQRPVTNLKLELSIVSTRPEAHKSCPEDA